MESSVWPYFVAKRRLPSARVEPAEMVSRPRSLQSVLASIIAGRSSIPHCAPNAQVDSNSGPSPSTFSVLLIRVQPIGQAQQDEFLTRYFSVNSSPEIASAPSN